MPADDSTTPTATSPSSMRRVVVACLIGTSLEWYDFFIYGTAAALVFNELFFPSFEPLVGTLLAFATYAVGFGARPLGGVVTRNTSNHGLTTKGSRKDARSDQFHEHPRGSPQRALHIATTVCSADPTSGVSRPAASRHQERRNARTASTRR